MLEREVDFFLDRRTFFHLECAGFLASFLANSFCPSFVQQANSLFHSVPVWRTLMSTQFYKSAIAIQVLGSAMLQSIVGTTVATELPRTTCWSG